MPAVFRVAVPVPLAQVFDYLPPAGDPARSIAPGARVVVPFGRSERVAVVVAGPLDSEIPVSRLKPILRVLDVDPLIGDELMASLQWTSRYYHHPIGEVLHTALPTGLRSERPLILAGERGLALVVDVPAPTLREGSRVQALHRLLAAGPLSYARLDASLPGWKSAATALKQRGLARIVELSASQAQRARIDAPPLTEDQLDAVRALQATLGNFAPALLEGITGSGKTEVYMSLIEQVVAQGLQALVLVPEIGLTPQAVRRFRDRLPGRIEVMHSGLSDGERTRAWLAAAQGHAQVIIGTRSAIFTPLPRAALIIVDEEHDASYKQQDGLRYSARDLALVRARALGVPVLLGSATPSLETLANAQAGRYAHLRLNSRPGSARLPAYHCIDLRGKPLHEGLAPEMISALRACVARGEQALVFRNRRGYAPVLLCHDCGWHPDCTRCDKPLTWHRGAARLRCHHCGAEQRIPAQCPQCGNVHLAPQGFGTERLEQTLGELFPEVPVVRVDRETTQRKHALDEMLQRFDTETAGILVGTQMLAKGHDLPNLTLVAIVGVDEGLFSVDFRASERLCQLVIQVAGRAGRARKPGAVYLQTHYPDHPLLRTLIRDGYDLAAEALLQERKATGLPPYAHLSLLRAEALAQPRVDAFLASAYRVAGKPEGVMLLGPMPAPMPRRAGKYRAQLLVSTDERSRMQPFLGEWIVALRGLREARDVRWSIDVDPLDLY